MPAADILQVPDWLTEAWLTHVMRERGVLPRGVIANIRVDPISGAGATGRLLRLVPEYRDASADAPPSLIAKLPSESPDVLDVARRFRLYERETRFYSEVAPLDELPTPRLYGTSATAAGDAVLLIEDMARARAGNVIAGAGSETLAPIVDALARVHARYWGSASLAGSDWLPRPNAEMTVSYSRERYEVAWRAFRERASLSEAVVAAGDRMCGDRSVLDQMALDPCTLTHGDLRLNNLMFDESGRLAAVLDWQSVTFARGPGDLAVLLIGNLPITAAPEDEPALVRRYLAGLVEAGVRGYSVEDCWTDYRLGALAHFASMVMLSQFMDLGRNLDATAEAIVGRPVAAVERLACFELLPALPASRRIRSAGVRVLRAVKRRVAQSAGV